MSILGRAFFTTFIFLISQASIWAQNEYVWAEKLGGNDVAIQGFDAYPGGGYAYAGYYPQTVTFNNGKTLPSNSKEKNFLASVDSSHKTKWVSKITGFYGSAHIEDLTIDRDSNHYITGMGQRYVYLHDTTGTRRQTVYLTYNSYRSTAYLNGYMAKFNKHGYPKWSVSLGHKWGNSHLEDAQLDDSGNVYVIGSFGSGSKGSSCYLTGVSAALQQVGYTDGLVAKYDSTGKLIWHRVLGSERDDNIRFMVSDGKGNLFIQISFGDTTTLDTVKIPALGEYLIKVNRKGRVLWAKEPIFGDHPVMGSDGNIYTDHSFYGVNPTFRSITLPSAATYSPLMASFDSLSNLRWIKAFPGKVSSNNNSYFGNILYSERTDQLYISGFARDTLDFGIGKAKPNSLYLMKASAKTGDITFLDTINTAVRGSSIFLGSNDEVYGNMQLRGPGYAGNGKITLDKYSFATLGNYSKDRILFEYDMGCSGKSLFVQGSTFVCQGDSVSLQAKGGHRLKWYVGNTLLDSTKRAIKVLPKGSTTYTVEFVDTVSNCTIRKTHTVGNYAVPVLLMDSVSARCADADSVVLQASSSIAGGTGVFSGIGVYDSIFRPDSAFPGVHTLTYTYTDAHQCVYRTTATARVLALPRVQLVGKGALCIGQSTNLVARGASTYKWTWLGGSSSQDSITVNPLSNTVYYLHGTDTHSCAASDSLAITVNSLPNIVASRDTVICATDSATLRVTGGTIHTWLFGNQVRNSIRVSPKSKTAYIVIGYDNNGCMEDDTIIVSVNALPNVTVTANTSICQGDTIELEATGAKNYAWTPGSHTLSKISVHPSTNTRYTVTGTDQNKCSNTDSVLVTVKTVPTLSAGRDTFICEGKSIGLSGTGASSYVWKPGNVAGKSITVQPKTTTGYQLTGTGSNGCKAIDSVTITVYKYPLVEVSKDTAICPGDSAHIKASGANLHIWTNGNIAQDYIFVNPSVKTSYRVIGSSFGCNDTATVTVDILALPNIKAGTDVAICPKESIDLRATGGLSYIWQPGNFKGGTYTVSPTQQSTYVVTGTDANGCLNSDTVLVNLHTLPIVLIAGDSVICERDTATLTATGAKDYNWLKGLGNTDLVKVAPNTTSNYTAIGIDNNGCIDSATFKVRVNPLPNVSTSLDQEICAGAEAEIEAQGASSYQWTDGLGKGAKHTVTPEVTTIYAVTGTDALGCSNSDSLEVTVNALPKVTLSGNEGPYCQDDDTKYVLNGLPGGGTYAGLGVDGQFFVPINAGVGSNWVTYLYTDNKGCANSDTLKIEVDDCLNVSTLEAGKSHVYPNPNRGQFSIELTGSKGEEVTAVKAWSSNGKQLDLDYTPLEAGKMTVRLPHYTGLAVVQIITETSTRWVEVTVVR